MSRQESSFSVGLGIALAGVWIGAAAAFAAWLGFWAWIAVGTQHRVADWAFWIVVGIVSIYEVATSLHDHLVKVGDFQSDQVSVPKEEPKTTTPQPYDHEQHASV